MKKGNGGIFFFLIEGDFVIGVFDFSDTKGGREGEEVVKRSCEEK